MTTERTTEPETMPPMAAVLSLWLGTSTNGTLAPTVALMHCSSVIFKLVGKGVSTSVFGPEEFDTGMFETNAAVLLYPSRESARLDAR